MPVAHADNRRRRLVLTWLAPTLARTRQRLGKFLLQHRLDKAARPSPNPVLDRVEPIIQKQSFGGHSRLLRGSLPHGVVSWIAAGHTDMRRGMQGLALQVEEQLKRDPHGGDLYIFRGRRGDLAKILWHDGLGLSLYAKRLDRGKFIWPSAKEGVVSISAAQMAYMLEGIDWRNPQLTWRPKSAG